MSTAISCKTTGEFQAEAIVYELKSAGFNESDIAVQFAEPGAILITVHTQDPQQIQDAEEIFRQTEALDISITEEAQTGR